MDSADAFSLQFRHIPDGVAFLQKSEMIALLVMHLDGDNQIVHQKNLSNELCYHRKMCIFAAKL